MKNVNTRWYQTIRPRLAPPKWVFPIIWTLLYISIGYALTKTLMLPESYNKMLLLCLFGFNLLLNIVWCYTFFGIKNIRIAVFILFATILSQTAILYFVYKLLPKNIFYLLIPYLLWLCFALVLNYQSLLALKKT